MTSEDVEESCRAVEQVLDFERQVGDEKFGLKEFVSEEAGGQGGWAARQDFGIKECVTEESGGGGCEQGFACRKITCREEATLEEEVFEQVFCFKKCVAEESGGDCE